MRLLCLAKAVLCASLSWKHPKCGRLTLTRRVPEVTLYTTIRTHTGHPQDTHQHNSTTTMKLRTSYLPTKKAQEAHRAMRWRETNDFQFECVDERKYPITYKKTRGQCPVCNPSICIPPPTTQSSNLAIPIQSYPIDQDQTRDCSWFIQHNALTRHKRQRKLAKNLDQVDGING